MKQKKVPTGRLSRVLAVIPKGIEKPVTVARISQMTGINARDIYSILRTLLMEYDVPIGGIRDKNSHGVFIATTETERAAALAPLANNATELTRRVAKLMTVNL